MSVKKETGVGIDRIQLALDRAKSQFKPDFWFEKQEQMTDLIGCSWVTLRKWINDRPRIETPDLMKRGGPGVPWNFCVIPFLSAMLATQQAEADIKTEANAELRRKLGVDLPDTEQTASMDDTRKLIGATLELNKARIEQKEFTPSQKFYDLFGEFVKDTVEGIMGLGIAVDPTGNLSPEAHELIDYHQRALSSHLHQKWSKRIELERARLEQSRII